jgi:hypothetical protein
LERQFAESERAKPNAQPKTNMPNDIENTAGSDCPKATCSGDSPDFITELRDLLNRHSMENGSDTPDFILAQYLTDCLLAWNRATKRREDWCGRTPREVSPLAPFERLKEASK